MPNQPPARRGTSVNVRGILYAIVALGFIGTMGAVALAFGDNSANSTPAIVSVLGFAGTIVGTLMALLRAELAVQEAGEATTAVRSVEYQMENVTRETQDVKRETLEVKDAAKDVSNKLETNNEKLTEIKTAVDGKDKEFRAMVLELQNKLVATVEALAKSQPGGEQKGG